MERALKWQGLERTFSGSIFKSVVIHLLIAAMVFLQAALFPSEPIVVRQAIRVDMVALPDKIKPTAVAAPAPEPVVAAPKPEPKVEPKPPIAKPQPAVEPKAPARDVKKEQQRALERLKAMNAIEQFKAETQKPKPDAPAEPQAPEKFKGNILSEGTGLSGIEQIAMERYFSEVEAKVKQHWNLPGWLAKAQLRAQVLVTIDGQGNVIKREVMRSSGQEVFDGQALQAVDRASPFPPPPDRLRGVLAMRGIVFNFPD